MGDKVQRYIAAKHTEKQLSYYVDMFSPYYEVRCFHIKQDTCEMIDTRGVRQELWCVYTMLLFNNTSS